MGMIPLFLDFDDTLFDTGMFKQRLIQIFAEHGISTERYHQTYQPLRQHYHPLTHAAALWKQPPSTLKVALDSLLQQAPSYCYPETTTFLHTINRTDYNVIFLTLGDTTFQREKIEAAGLAPYAQHIEVCQEEKWLALNKLLPPHSPFILIDDRPDTIIMTARSHPQSYGIIINRGHTERAGRFPLFQVVHSLSELAGNELRRPYPMILPSLDASRS
jgi:FMN phosphatase YigB (HAD superfamily)